MAYQVMCTFQTLRMSVMLPSSLEGKSSVTSFRPRGSGGSDRWREGYHIQAYCIRHRGHPVGFWKGEREKQEAQLGAVLHKSISRTFLRSQLVSDFTRCANDSHNISATQVIIFCYFSWISHPSYIHFYGQDCMPCTFMPGQPALSLMHRVKSANHVVRSSDYQ